LEATFEKALVKGFEKVDYLVSSLNGFPHITKGGRWLENRNGHWTGGFWTGLLWLHYLETGAERFKEEALLRAGQLACRRDDNTTHDQGFIFGPSCIMGYNITGNMELKKQALDGAGNMFDLYDRHVELIRAWAETDYERIAIVDTMMNLPILLWAANQANKKVYWELALSVIDVIQKYHIREDSSTYHVVRWDESYRITGGTHQGYADETCWSRGQAWAFYGFANVYRYTGNAEYLEQANQLARYYIDHLDADYQARWDFVFRDDARQPVDSSAGAIAASGLMLLAQLYKQIGNEKQYQYFKTNGEAIVRSLIQHCLYEKTDCYGILEKATVDLPRNSGIGESTMYGDYYFMEALYRIKYENNEEKIALLY
jgi:unsaturated chondroitin disaccharide hydrolase